MFLYLVLRTHAGDSKHAEKSLWSFGVSEVESPEQSILSEMYNNSTDR